jgi:hypothetical protein
MPRFGGCCLFTQEGIAVFSSFPESLFYRQISRIPRF